tara:strand:- start:241 stop:873 length:633 start_codon:yes stop_codon:yes gene_type:complete
MPLFTPVYSDTRDGGHAEILETKETYVGKVLETYEENGRDDSDFYAVVWDDETNCLRHKLYATTRFYSNGYGAKIDATEEVVAKATAERKERFLQSEIEKDEEKAKTVAKGKKVEVVSGRKNRGAIGEVFWVGNPEKFSYYSKEHRSVGIKLNDERDDNGKFKNVVFAYDYNCGVINYESYLTDAKHLEEIATNKANSYSYSYPVPGTTR